MTDTDRIAALEAEVETLQARQALGAAADDALEEAIRDRVSLERAVVKLFEVLGKGVGAKAAWVRTYDETLKLRDFVWPDAGALPGSLDELYDIFKQAASIQSNVVGQPIDVAGEAFGVAAMVIDGTVTGEHAVLLNIWCEQLDNYLAAIANARRKHQVATALSEALRHPLLDVGVEQAISALQSSMAVGDMVLVYRHDDDPTAATLAYKVVKDGKLLHSSSKPSDAETDAFLREHGLGLLLRDDTSAVTEKFGLRQFAEEVLISGVQEQVVGRVLASSTDERELSRFDRDLLELFASFLRQRIVDFNREWAHLSLAFPRDVVGRLLSVEGYADEYLTPRERNVAILYVDISGFTRVSEQVLKEPPLIGKLIDTWGDEVVDIIWRSGGVFDKMVGDCVIGIWGPPFFEMSDQEACKRAAESAIAIRDYTKTLSKSEALPELSGEEMGVSTGLNFCPLFVGRFGPNQNYTGFSSGMNNTARLQGVADKDQILCMDNFVDTIGSVADFGEAGEAKVKNVAEPLKFRPLTKVV